MSEYIPSKGLLGLFCSGIVIAGLCYYKTTRTYQRVDIDSLQLIEKRRAPLFELYDHHKPSELVRLSSYLGRHRVMLIFFDGKVGPYADRRLQPFLQKSATLKASRTIVIGISDALPQTYRQQIANHQQAMQSAGKTEPPFPFLLLSDPDYRVHRQYGRYQHEQALPGLFEIDRLGDLEWESSGPIPQPEDLDSITRLIAKS